jgi:hypothetical protein
LNCRLAAHNKEEAMSTLKISLLLVGLLVVNAAGAQTSMRVRGTITSIDGDVMSVKARDGSDLKLQLPDNVAVTVAKAYKFEDIKRGDYVGATTVLGAEGTLTALEVHYIPPTVPDGHGPWDLQPGSMMTNANVDSIVTGTGKRELTLQYKGGSQTMRVPDTTPIVRAVPGARADLVPGEYIFAAVQVAADGKMTAPRIQVSKDGVRPPQ